ncbi:methylated-DNA--[protein]-cysteine S-methyltransferase [Actinomadura madurae]|uniref:methylated-DNA--[protein]-cysteine S-methyltransferase n=1 Tax=Actinomadura madurae TaxID=1993 RepID=UPI0020D21CC0|nr:methylated-DNA--[protein]-cysteine S-methyltransferase [Actinomadura madurae]MCP9947697.1 methylated-DNA--[protein]-cysteine S-methyltransferase [Actinomadura madurae]MCP9976945.1 methylated-DNA--[protein]-cysteine S-methyltransferase [Actinomadura madurae]
MTRTDPAGGPAGAGPDRDLARELAALAADAPPALLDRIAARRVHVPGPLEGLQVAFTDHGVAYLRAGMDEQEFAAVFRARFARPLLPAARPPAGLVPALRTGRLGGLRLDLRGLSDFEAAVLRAAARIPRGQTRPYAWVARQAGRPKAVRAVGSALGRNPVPLLIPCHRVTRSDGALGDYVFGVGAKERLLRAEDVDVDEAAELARRGVRLVGSDTTGIVCYPTCGDARRIGPGHRRGFRDLAAARAAGYRPCLHCRPGDPDPRPA